MSAAGVWAAAAVAISVPSWFDSRICVLPMRPPSRVASAVAVKCVPRPGRRKSTRRSMVPILAKRCSTCAVLSPGWRSAMPTISAVMQSMNAAVDDPDALMIYGAQIEPDLAGDVSMSIMAAG